MLCRFHRPGELPPACYTGSTFASKYSPAALTRTWMTQETMDVAWGS